MSLCGPSRIAVIYHDTISEKSHFFFNVLVILLVEFGELITDKQFVLLAAHIFSDQMISICWWITKTKPRRSVSIQCGIFFNSLRF